MMPSKRRTTSFSSTRQPKKHARGENHYKSAFSDKQVQILRAIYQNTNITLGALARMFNVTRSCMFGIMSYATYKHVRDLEWHQFKITFAFDGESMNVLYFAGTVNKPKRNRKPIITTYKIFDL